MIAALNGHCVGGGLEVAMAADLRVARAGAGKIGLPEVALGVLPGTGGTQRLARLVGKAKAMELMVTGALLTMEEARDAGLVHQVWGEDVLAGRSFRDTAIDYAKTFAPPNRASRAVGHIKRAVQSGLEAELQRRAWPSSASCSSGCSKATTPPRGWPPTSRSGRRASPAAEARPPPESARHDDTPPTPRRPRRRHHGPRHRLCGHRRRLPGPALRRLGAAADQGRRTSSPRIVAKSVELGKLTQADAAAARGRLTTTTSVAEAVRDTAMVIEAAPEKMDLKLALLAEVQAAAPADAVIASNTSALGITEMAAVLDRPARMGGMHFFNPVHKMKLVEIVRALETSDETLAAMQDVAAAMGKETVLVRESPGFVTSRINAMIGNEAFYMLQEGVASARDIDKALKLGLNHPMGPFELVDLVGLDTRLSILQYLHRTLGEKFRPCPLLEQYVKAGRLGRKAGKGVYDY